ncbi:MAG: class I SAM-dependent methyltransferase [Desulfobacteraceae bacterium]|nr:MAG: class I SAM-dependent methyltransferase [Desulfobacteraceae bacterium]
MKKNMKDWTSVPTEEIDWNGMWIQAMLDASARNKKFEWDTFAERYNEWSQHDDYPEKFLQKVPLQPDWTVLDVGCGTGVVTLPLAKKVKQVTALDMSEPMLKHLKEKLTRERIVNVEWRQLNWEAPDIEKQIQPHDAVIASRALVMQDARQALARMHALARCKVFLSWRVGERLFDRQLYDAIGRPYHEYPTYIYLYNILYQMGIYADVDFMESRSRICFFTIDDAMDHWRWKIHDLKLEEEKPLRTFLEQNLTQTDQGILDAPFMKTHWAVLSWSKQAGPA